MMVEIAYLLGLLVPTAIGGVAILGVFAWPVVKGTIARRRNRVAETESD